MAILSVLDLSPINEGGTVTEALNNSRLLAQHAEKLGYHRYWVAEHHNMKGIASAATSILISHIASGTQKIRVGSGGIMLPNHAPLMLAEQFGTLSALDTLLARANSPRDAAASGADFLMMLGYLSGGWQLARGAAVATAARAAAS